MYSFFKAFAPPEITITEKYISTNQDFINGFAIEKLKVDSLGEERYPVKYTVTYITTCSIQHPVNKPPDPPSKIVFNKKGKYVWRERHVNIPYIQTDINRSRTDSSQGWIWGFGEGEFATCPLKLERQEWYFLTIPDPQVNGIFFYIDSTGKTHQVYMASGVCPI